MNQREPIPIDIRRRLLIECAFKCSIPQCQTEWPTLQFHHINGNPRNNRLSNILVLCPTCYQKVSSKQIDRKSCKTLKRLIQDFSAIKPSQITGRRSNILYFLLAELSANLHLIAKQNFQKGDGNIPYTRLRHIVLDEAIASGVFIYDHDIELFNLLYDLSTNISDLNHRLDLIEFRLSPHETIDFASNQAYVGSQQRCIKVIEYILDYYGQILEVNAETEFFGVKLENLMTPGEQ